MVRCWERGCCPNKGEPAADAAPSHLLALNSTGMTVSPATERAWSGKCKNAKANKMKVKQQKEGDGISDVFTLIS